jgi:hypothetical protein
LYGDSKNANIFTRALHLRSDKIFFCNDEKLQEVYRCLLVNFPKETNMYLCDLNPLSMDTAIFEIAKDNSVTHFTVGHEALRSPKSLLERQFCEEKLSQISFIFSLSRSFALRTVFCFAAQIRNLGDGPLRDVLASLGGWPVTQPNWEPPDFSVETLLGRLRGEFNEGVLIEQWVGPDDKNSSANILQVRTK